MLLLTDAKYSIPSSLGLSWNMTNPFFFWKEKKNLSRTWNPVKKKKSLGTTAYYKHKPHCLQQACSVRVTFQHFISFSQNNTCQGQPGSWGWTRRLWKENQALSQVTAAGSVSAFGCSQVMRRHSRCQVLIHKPIRVRAGGEGGIQTGMAGVRSLRCGLAALPLLWSDFFLYNLDESFFFSFFFFLWATQSLKES